METQASRADVFLPALLSVLLLKLYISKAIFQRHYRTTNLDLLRDLASQEGTAERVNKYTDIQIKFKLDNSYL